MTDNEKKVLSSVMRWLPTKSDAVVRYRDEPKGWRVLLTIKGRRHGSPWLSSPIEIEPWVRRQFVREEK